MPARRSSRRNSDVDTLVENVIDNADETKAKPLDPKSICTSDDEVTHTQVTEVSSPADETDTSVEENKIGDKTCSSDGDNVAPTSTQMESDNTEISLNPPSPIPVSQTQNEEEESDEGGDHHDTSSTSDEIDRTHDKCENGTSISSPATKSESVTSSPESGTGEEEEEQWDLVHVFTPEELKRDEEKAQSCMTKNCPLLACVTYRSSLDADNKDLWHSCIDCQEKDFGGWPEELNELPITFMSQEHKKMIVEMCTAQYCPDMPKLPDTEGGSITSEEEPDTTVVGNKDDEKAPENVSSVTPPRPQCAQSKTDNGGVRKQKKSLSKLGTSASGVPKVSPMPMPQKKKPSAIPKCYQKWQEESDKKGGGKIIVKKVDAKPIIFDMLKDAFRPMNITQIYNELKASIPAQVLKMCLDDMALDHFDAETQFADSDDENDDNEAWKKPKKKPEATEGDDYAGTLIAKAGRSSNVSLYYVDYKKTINNGNGFLPDARNELICASQKAKADLKAMTVDMKSVSEETAKLLLEPTNEELNNLLEKKEGALQSLQEKVQEHRHLKENEKLRKQTQKKIDYMAAHWRKRERICMNFLTLMEDATEGTISVKKCLAGDGQIEIDSNEEVVKGAKAYAQMKRDRGSTARKRSISSNSASGNSFGSSKRQKIQGQTSGTKADDSFIGVQMTNNGVKRIYLDGDKD